eukprot:587225_1
MASYLMLQDDSSQKSLSSYFTQLESMEIQAVQLITECATLHCAKQNHIANVKSQINASFENIIQKLRSKQNDSIQELNGILGQNQKEQSVLSTITSIINQQKQYLSHSSDTNRQINANFLASKQLFDAHVASVQQSMHSLNDKNRITRVMHDVERFVKMQNDVLKTDEPSSSNLAPPLFKPMSYFCQKVSQPLQSFVVAVNILTEYLPNKLIQQLMHYVSNNNPIDVANYLKKGWKVKDEILHDYPDIYVQNVLPIANQPSLILTIGLPGSGKTTWAKIRVGDAFHHHVLAADDYFDKFNAGQYKPKLLSKAHDWCQQQVEIALRMGNTVVANNTNTTLSEIRRGVHGVPPWKCGQMMKRMCYWLNQGPPSVRVVLKTGPFYNRMRSKDVSPDVVYTGVFMSETMQDRLRRYFVAMSGEALLASVTDCHLTLKFQPLYRDVNIMPFGKQVSLKMIGFVAHEYVQCFVVDILDDEVNAMCANKYAHITIAYDETVARPQYSNDALQYGKVTPIINNSGFIVEATAGAFYKSPRGVSLQRRNRRY